MRIIKLDEHKKKPKKIKVCAYVRVSTNSDRQGESFKNQIQYYKKYIKNHPDYTYVSVFADRAISGTKSSRPELQRMIELCRKGQIDLILTKAISRFARNTTIMLAIVRELKELGVAILFEKENIHTLSGDGELMLAVLSSFAQEESRNVRENLKWRIREKFQRGELIINTNRFLGYDKDDEGNLIINEEQAKIVRRIFAEYIAFKGAFKIANELNNDGVETVTGSQWHESSIRNMLKNEKYKGDVLLQKYYVPEGSVNQSIPNNGVLDSYYIEDNHLAIISKGDWDRAQEIRKERAEVKGNYSSNRNKYTKRYPLSKKLYCSKCGHTLRRRTWNSKHKCKKIVWQCSHYIKNGKKACEGTVIDDEIISAKNITVETIIEEVRIDGKKYYNYTSKNKSDESSQAVKTKEKKNGSLL